MGEKGVAIVGNQHHLAISRWSINGLCWRTMTQYVFAILVEHGVWLESWSSNQLTKLVEKPYWILFSFIDLYIFSISICWLGSLCSQFAEQGVYLFVCRCDCRVFMLARNRSLAAAFEITQSLTTWVSMGVTDVHIQIHAQTINFPTPQSNPPTLYKGPYDTPNRKHNRLCVGCNSFVSTHRNRQLLQEHQWVRVICDWMVILLVN